MQFGIKIVLHAFNSPIVKCCLLHYRWSERTIPTCFQRSNYPSERRGLVPARGFHHLEVGGNKPTPLRITLWYCENCISERKADLVPTIACFNNGSAQQRKPISASCLYAWLLITNDQFS